MEALSGKPGKTTEGQEGQGKPLKRFQGLFLMPGGAGVTAPGALGIGAPGGWLPGPLGEMGSIFQKIYSWGGLYQKRKGYFSLILLVVCVPELRQVKI